MLQFVIGLGVHSVSGAFIEHALRDVYPMDDFWIEPIVELEYELSNLTQLQRRATILLSECAKHIWLKPILVLQAGKLLSTPKMISGLRLEWM